MYMYIVAYTCLLSILYHTCFENTSVCCYRKKEAEPFASGASSQVFKRKHGRSTVAIKVMSLFGTRFAQRQKVTAAFMGEMSILVKLRHPQILRHSFFYVDSTCTHTCEYSNKHKCVRTHVQ